MEGEALKLRHNAFEIDKTGTAARSQAQDRIEVLRGEGGIFVEAVRATRMPMTVTDPSLSGNPIIFANEAFLILSGYSMEEVLGQQPHFLNGPDTMTRCSSSRSCDRSRRRLRNGRRAESRSDM
ncbi:PAS domain-containing protein [Sphingomonas sp. JC676]|uniref:PAS domain-containing protein n=1 Tax=Sphingomonas sp. JC676 TaxID=2768065 RepID=UPI00165815ED|nr:PAS domain-containing protein [Sphingomonas sp. JC676]MBC9033818.1 PAS domain-containing protein [Sphingomonas sp. JC676]